MVQGVSPTFLPRLPSSTIVLPGRCEAWTGGVGIAAMTSAAPTRALPNNRSVQRLKVHLLGEGMAAGDRSTALAVPPRHPHDTASATSLAGTILGGRVA